MKLFEYQSKMILYKEGLPVPKHVFIKSKEDLNTALQHYARASGVLKAQVLTGGRGKAGGIKVFNNHSEAETLANELFGKKLITKQTGEEGIIIESLLIEELTNIQQELYVAVLVDRTRAAHAIMISLDGGVNIEDVAANTPERISYIYPQYNEALNTDSFNELKPIMQMNDKTFDAFCQVVIELYSCFLKYDATMLEINPLAISSRGEFKVLDCKMDIDDNALFRQTDFADIPNPEYGPAEIEADSYGLNYIAMDGNIGCMVNGAGLAMATMDAIKEYGGEPANFLDVGGSASEQAITKALELITSDTKVKAILVNIFGGIMHCDIIAKGIISALSKSDIKTALVVRLEGTNSALGKELINNSGLNIISASKLDEAAKKVISII